MPDAANIETILAAAGLADYRECDEAEQNAAPPQTIAKAEFLACVDGCVRELLVATTADRACDASRLQGWLRDGVPLNDGNRIDGAALDEAIFSVEERLPEARDVERSRLLSASRRLAELLYLTAPVRAAA